MVSPLNSQRAQVFLIAGWFGLLSGLLEATVFSVVRFVPDWITWGNRLVNVSWEILWISPVFNALLFLVLACCLTLMTSWIKRLPLFRRITPQTLAVFLFGLMSFYAIVRVIDRISPWASCLLALGLSVQVSRWFQARQQVAIAMFRRGLAPLLLMVFLAGSITTGLGIFREDSLMERLPPAPHGSPNVLVVVLDTLRADHLSSYGYHRSTTPNIDKFAQEGVLFEKAFATSSWTVPSHASLMTGRYMSENGADGLQLVLGEHNPTLAEVMASEGYITAGFSANTWWVTRNSGFDRGFLHFEDYFHSVADMAARTVYGKEIFYRLLPRLGYRDNLGRKRAGDVNQAFLRWLDANSRRPFFAFLNYMEVHAPYLSPYPYHNQFMNRSSKR